MGAAERARLSEVEFPRGDALAGGNYFFLRKF